MALAARTARASRECKPGFPPVQKGVSHGGGKWRKGSGQKSSQKSCRKYCRKLCQKSCRLPPCCHYNILMLPVQHRFWDGGDCYAGATPSPLRVRVGCSS